MDQNVLNNMKKGLRPEMITQGIEDTLKVGISPGLNFIFGNHGDNKETIKLTVDFLLKYDVFAQKRTIRPVTPYPGSPLYYDAIEMGLLDKDNPCEDFYENKHLNSDLICCNFTELSDKEFYECLRWANQTLMKNYFDKQREGTLAQIDHLYKEKDVTFRGFRQNSGAGDIRVKEGAQVKTKASQGNKKYYASGAMDGTVADPSTGLVNWESSQTGDAERFSQDLNGSNGKRYSRETSFANYLMKKEIRMAAKIAARVSNKVTNELKVENSLLS
jgi:hypothetical protein